MIFNQFNYLTFPFRVGMKVNLKLTGFYIGQISKITYMPFTSRFAAKINNFYYDFSDIQNK